MGLRSIQSRANNMLRRAQLKISKHVAEGQSPGVSASTATSSSGSSGRSFEAATRREQRLSHMTNYELERLFAMSAAPAASAALRFGNTNEAAKAAARLQKTIEARRQEGSQGFLRSW